MALLEDNIPDNLAMTLKGAASRVPGKITIFCLRTSNHHEIMASLPSTEESNVWPVLSKTEKEHAITIPQFVLIVFFNPSSVMMDFTN